VAETTAQALVFCPRGAFNGKGQVKEVRNGQKMP
jgi:hypothetical protein